MHERVESERVIATSPAELWKAVTADGWLAEEVRLELFAGGEAQFRDADSLKHGWVEEAIAPADDGQAGRLAFWWAADGEAATRVELTLEPYEDGTRLRVLETRPLDLLDLIGVPLPGLGGQTFGPALVVG